MNKLILLLVICNAYADNQALFNSAMTAGSQNQVNMNLNQNSNIETYGQTNKFDPSVAQNANAGNAPAKEMYSHISGSKADNNYLYNSGSAAIQDCLSRHDPRCTTLNKYGDKDTQTGLQAYAQGISSRYAITIKPDPSNSACSLVTKKEAINPHTEICVSGMQARNQCTTTINIGTIVSSCLNEDSSCNQYKNNQDCALISPEVKPVCQKWRYHIYYGCRSDYYPECISGTTFHTTGWCGGTGYENVCDGRSYEDGRGGTPTCTQYSSPTPATYSCKTAQLNDECSRFKGN